MRCDEFESRLEEILDERLSPASDPLLKEHAALCAECRHRAAAYESMLVGLGLCQAPSWDDPELSERVLAEIRRPALLHLVHSRPWTFATALLATAALILVVVSLSLRPRGDAPQPGPENLAHSPPHQPVEPPKPLEQTHEPQALDELARAAGDKYMVLMRQTGESVAEVLELVPGLPRNEQAPTGISADDTSTQSWAAEMAQGLEPVTDSTRSALRSLWLAIPTADEDTRS